MSTNNRISNLVNTQVPFFVRSDHRTFVAFLEAYYEYLEQNSAILNQGKTIERAENLLNYIDVDHTLPEFSEKLYNTFLSLLPKEINTDKEVLIKNIKDFYRAKGTEKSLKFLLRILSDGEETEIYYPKLDILRASDGKWFIQKSLRVKDISVDGIANTLRSSLDLFTSKNITGNTSNASAIIERTDRFYENGVEINELIISSDKGNFRSDEIVFTTFLENGATKSLTANIFGGLDSITITEPGSGYSIGNDVIITSNTGAGAAAYVSKVSSGNVANISVEYGGAGFLANGYVLFTGGGSGSGANAKYITVDTSGNIHPNTYNIFSSIILIEANTLINTANYPNMSHTIISLPNANSYLINILSTFVYGPTGPITSVLLNSSGDGYTSIPSADAIANSVVKSLGILGRMNLVNSGLGYTAGDRIEFFNIPGGTGAGANAQVASVFANGKINTIRFTANTGWITGGMGYSQSALPTANIRTSTGSGGNVTVTAILGDGEVFDIGTSTIGQIEEIIITSRGDGYQETPLIDLTQSGDGLAEAYATFISGVFTYPGRYLNDDGHLSSYNFLQNRDYYQNYSYVVKIHKALSEYKNYLEKIVHPSGTKIFGEYMTEDNAENKASESEYILNETSTQIAPLQNDLFGINLSGLEYAPWFYQTFPTEEDFSDLRSVGVDYIRLPFAWESLQPVLNGELNVIYLTKIKTIIQMAKAFDIDTIVSVHNFGSYADQDRWNHVSGNVGYAGNMGIANTGVVQFSSGGLTVNHFTDMLSKLATELKGIPGYIGLGIMNEPVTPQGTNLIRPPNYFKAHPFNSWFTINGANATMLAANTNPLGTSYGPAWSIDSGTGYGAVGNPVGNVASVPHTLSVYVKCDVGTEAVQLYINNAVSGTLTANTNWQRISYTGTPSPGPCDVFIMSQNVAGHIIKIANAQLEVGSNATAYVPNPYLSYAQAAINSIRAIDETIPIYVCGIAGTAVGWPQYNYELTLLTGNPIVLEAHQYFDGPQGIGGGGAYSGTYASYGITANQGSVCVSTFTNYLSNTSMSGFLGEFGVPSANLAEWLAVQNTALITLRTADVPGAGWFYGANGFYSVNNLNLANTPGDSRLAQILDA